MHLIQALVKYSLGLFFFFLILGLRIFFQNIKVGGGKKKKKITKKNFFLFNLKHIWIGEKKNCMILQCKNAEMTIILPFLHFYSVKSYNVCYVFFNIYFFFFKSGSFLHQRK